MTTLKPPPLDDLGSLSVGDEFISQFQHIPPHLSADPEQSHGEQLIVLTNFGRMFMFDADNKCWTPLTLPDVLSGAL